MMERYQIWAGKEEEIEMEFEKWHDGPHMRNLSCPCSGS